MADKNFKVKNKLVINGLAGNAGPLIADGSNVVDSTPYIATQYGGTGTTTSPSAGQVLYSASGTTYSPTLFSTLPGVYARGDTASRPASPNVGDLYFNSELNYFESYTSNGWFPIAAAPLAPTGVTATNQGSGRAFNNGQASVAFTPNTSGGAPTSFILTPTPTTSPATFTGSSSPIIATGLASSTQYTYTVAATSPYGTSSASSASSGVTATTVPQAPTINSVTGASQSAVITFTAGATGGSAISSYSITSSPATTTQTASSSPYTFTGLTDGTSYTFTMTATNANGTSLASSASSAVVPSSVVEDMVPLGVVTVDSSSVSYIEFTSIPQNYKHLQIRFFGGFNTQPGFASGKSYLNGDTTNTNYKSHQLNGDGASATASSYSVPYLPISTGPDGYPCFYVIDLLDYNSTSKNKTIRALGGWDANGSGQIILGSALWMNTAAVTSYRIQCDGGYSWKQYTSAALYGIKG